MLVNHAGYLGIQNLLIVSVIVFYNNEFNNTEIFKKYKFMIVISHINVTN